MTTAVSKAWESTGGVMPKELVPQQRMGNEEELAGTVLYLASKVRSLFTPKVPSKGTLTLTSARLVGFVMAA